MLKNTVLIVLLLEALVLLRLLLQEDKRGEEKDLEEVSHEKRPQ